MEMNFLNIEGIKILLRAIAAVFKQHTDTIDKLYYDDDKEDKKGVLNHFVLEVDYEAAGLFVDKEWGYDEFLE